MVSARYITFGAKVRPVWALRAALVLVLAAFTAWSVGIRSKDLSHLPSANSSSMFAASTSTVEASRNTTSEQRAVQLESQDPLPDAAVSPSPYDVSTYRPPTPPATCSDSVAVDSAGNACMDFRYELRGSTLYASRHPSATYVVCAIPKNSCTVHLGVLGRLHGLVDYERPRGVHSFKDPYLLRAVDDDEIAKMLIDKDIPKYAVVRNPLTRVLSGYLSKVWKPLPEAERTVEHFERWVRQEFGNGGCLRVDEKCNPHWRAQSSFCGFGVRDVGRYLRVFRVEEPEAFVDFLYGILPDSVLEGGWKGEENVGFREYVLGPTASHRTGGTSEKVLKFFRDVEVFDFLAHALWDDVVALGYVDEVRKVRKEIVERAEKEEG